MRRNLLIDCITTPLAEYVSHITQTVLNYLTVMCTISCQPAAVVYKYQDFCICLLYDVCNLNIRTFEFFFIILVKLDEFDQTNKIYKK